MKCKNCNSELSGYQKKFCSCKCSSVYNSKIRPKIDNRITRICKQCDAEFKVLSYDHKKFCNSSCAATYNNQKRNPRTNESKNKTSTSIKKFITQAKINGTFSNKTQFKPKNKNAKKTKNLKNKLLPEGPFTKVFQNKCQRTNVIFFSASYRKYSSDLIYKERSIYAANAKFRFNVYEYPNQFDLSLLDDFGWYHPVNNPHGISRDHRISISYGWENKIDPNIISHPVNCELMHHIDNQRKKKNSSISLDFLLQEIKKWS